MAILAVAVGLGVLTLLGLAIWVLPPTLVQGQLAKNATITDSDRLKAINDVRGALLTGLGVLAVFSGSLVAYLNFRGTLELNRRGQVTDRFGKAIDQIGKSDQLDVRIGGIYALEQIARDSEDLHWPVMEVLTAFVREHAKPGAGAQPASMIASAPPAISSKAAPDIQAAVTVLGRRDASRDAGGLNLRGASLEGANLVKANLGSTATWLGVDLTWANLQRASIVGANLQRANLVWTNLQGADLLGANLQGATLSKANFEGARLGSANLQAAFVYEANLKGADLGRANLRYMYGKDANLQGADLTGASLADAWLPQANLKSADLGRANLQAANLSGAQLEGASLQEANLEGANLSRTSLKGANLSRTNLRGAIFEDPQGWAANGLTWEQLSGAHHVDEATLPAYLREATPGNGPEAVDPGRAE